MQVLVPPPFEASTPFEPPPLAALAGLRTAALRGSLRGVAPVYGHGGDLGKEGGEGTVTAENQGKVVLFCLVHLVYGSAGRSTWSSFHRRLTSCRPLILLMSTRVHRLKDPQPYIQTLTLLPSGPSGHSGYTFEFWHGMCLMEQHRMS